MSDYQFISFYLGENLFGLNIIHIREIIQRFDITPVEGTNKYVMGVLNLRGQIVTVLNPGTRLGVEKQEIRTDARCIVLKTTPELNKTRSDGFMEEDTSLDWLGLVVDEMGDVITVNENDIAPPPANLSGLDSRFISGVVSLQNNLLILLKISELVAV